MQGNELMKNRTNKPIDKLKVMENYHRLGEESLESHPEKKSSEFNLVAKTSFRNYQRGDVISDENEINSILGCHEKLMVNKIFTKQGN